MFVSLTKIKHIRIYQEFEDRIKKSIPRITIWYHEACREISKGDLEGRILLSHCHTNNGFFFLLTIQFCNFILINTI